MAMNNFILDEMSAEEYRKDRMAEAKAHNKLVRYLGKQSNPGIFTAIRKVSALFKLSGGGIPNREVATPHNKYQEMIKSSK